MAKLPTRSPTHADVDMGRLATMGVELEELAGGDDNDRVELQALVEHAEDRGRPPSHYLAAVALASELQVSPLPTERPLAVRVCAGTCQRYGALDLLDHLVARTGAKATFAIVPTSCLDRCDQAPACEIVGAHGSLVLAPATKASLDEALDSLA